MADLPKLEPADVRDVPRRWRISPIWFVPVLALLAALGVAIQDYARQGPLIDVVFAEANGLEAGATELRYRDIAVGLVEELRFSDDLAAVIASIRLDQKLAPFVDDGAEFWIVRPQVTAQGVTGLETVLSGVYIAGSWDNVPGTVPGRFEALPTPPLIALGEQGSLFTLRSETALPSAGTPILYKGVAVGRIGPATLDPGGVTASAPAVVLAPHDQLVSSATRFWDVSGLDFSLGVEGAQLSVGSLASLVAGGITFETFAPGGRALRDGAEFLLHPDEETAQEDFIDQNDSGTLDVLAVFDENLPGLQTGAAVTLGGLRLGQVVALSGVVDRARFGDSQVRLQATLRLTAGRVGLGADAGPEDLTEFLSMRIAGGLRARLTTASILTGGLIVELVDVPEAAPASLRLDEGRLPEIPTTPARVTDVAGSAQSVLARVNALPIEEVLEQATGLMVDLRAVIGSAEMRAAPASVLATLDAIRAVATSDAVADLPGQVAALATEAAQASSRLNALLAQAEDSAVIAELAALIDSLDTAAQTLPAVAQEAEALLAQVRGLPLEALTGQATQTLESVDILAANPDLAALPADLRQGIAVLQSLLADPALADLPEQLRILTGQVGSAVARVDGLIADVQGQDIVGATAQTVTALRDTAQTLPGLSEQAGRVLERAEALAFDQVLEDAAQAMASLSALLEQESTRTLPQEVNQTLAEMRGAVADLRAGGLIDNANATLSATRDAAEAIAAASETLPDLSQRLQQAAAQATATLADFDERSDFARDLSATIAQVDAAADAIERLARQIARNPNSLLTGR